jgi:hypothetical protein
LVQTALVKLIDHMSRIDEDMGSVAAQHMGKKVAITVIALSCPNVAV